MVKVRAVVISISIVIIIIIIIIITTLHCGQGLELSDIAFWLRFSVSQSEVCGLGFGN